MADGKMVREKWIKKLFLKYLSATLIRFAIVMHFAKSVCTGVLICIKMARLQQMRPLPF